MRGGAGYSYTRITANDPPRPLLKAHLRVGISTTTEDVLCLVDSGADRNIFPMDFAARLNLTLDTKRVWPFYGTTGRLQRGYLHSVNLAIYDNEDAKVLFDFSTEVAFCEDFKFTLGPLLGQTGFFSHFKVFIDQRNGSFRIKEH